MNGSPQDSSSYYAISGESNVNVFALIFLFVVGVAVLRSKRQGCIAAMLLAALVALLHPLGYVAVALLVLFLWRGRARADEKYAGLRILR